MGESLFNIALAGNPNCGKTSLFNQITGLRQKTGNYPGVTVDKKSALIQFSGGKRVTLTDLPGNYSLHPTTEDERVVIEVLMNSESPDHPDFVVYVADSTDLEKHLLMFTQILDLGIPIGLVLNMSDLADKKQIDIDLDRLSIEFGVPVMRINSRSSSDIAEFKLWLDRQIRDTPGGKRRQFYRPAHALQKMIEKIRALNGFSTDYKALLAAHHCDDLPFLASGLRKEIGEICAQGDFHSLRAQIDETMSRYDRFIPMLNAAVRKRVTNGSLTERVDSVLTHRLLGPVIFLALMFLVFQAIFAWATYPMDWIEMGFGWLSSQCRALLPAGWFTNLLTDGILAGLGGIMVFIPQIAILFVLINILEEAGYMARAVFLFDRVMRFFGLNGRSIVALISGGACAIPAIMSTRTIADRKQRLITILVTPFISCSARIPVYIVLIGFVVPATAVWGIFNAQGLVFLALYLLGIAAALLSAAIFKKILKSRNQGPLMQELPRYKWPDFRNVVIDTYEKVKTFVIEAGKVILVISIILWFLASFGPPGQMAEARVQAAQLAAAQNLPETEAEDLAASLTLEASYAGRAGKVIEPIIQPLGFDWKIGIALITSFAAREVFVGTMATLYSIGSVSDELTIQERLASETDVRTGKPVYTMATSLSLILFYVFAMQCMSTLAVVRRETKTWKWPVIQFVFMSVIAYLASLLAYQILA